jgi:protein ImuB
MRLACALAVAFPLQAAARERPELKTLAVPIAIHAAEESPVRAQVTAVNRAAAVQGVRCGVGLSQARAICPELLLVPIAEGSLAVAAEALRNAAAQVSPAVEEGPRGSIYAELGSVVRLHGGEREAASELQVAIRHAGLEVFVGVAGTRLAARAAARRHTGIELVPEGQERSYLAPLPLSTLDASPQVFETFGRWGLGKLGELAELPRAGIGARLGPEGVRLHRLACGEEVELWQPLGEQVEIGESVELEWGVGQIEPLLFAMKLPLERLVLGLAERGLSCSKVSLRLELDPHGLALREVEVAAPTRDLPALTTLLRYALEREPPGAPVVGIRVSVGAARARPGQQRLFGLPTVPPERLWTTLARLESLAGPGNVGAPELRDTHLPGADSATVGRFSPPPPPEGDVQPAGQPLATLRLFRPPKPTEVIVERGRPAALSADGVRGRIVDFAGPWPVQADWWGEQARALDCYDVSLSDGGTYRLAYDRRCGKWELAGEYD